jgi:hypothetical protein
VVAGLGIFFPSFYRAAARGKSYRGCSWRDPAAKIFAPRSVSRRTIQNAREICHHGCHHLNRSLRATGIRWNRREISNVPTNLANSPREYSFPFDIQPFPREPI